jgi:hypothetical protein
MIPPFFEQACVRWANYLREEIGKKANPNDFADKWANRRDEFRRAVGWSLAKGYPRLVLHPADQLRKLKRAGR